MSKEDAHLPSNSHPFFSDIFSLSERKMEWQTLSKLVPTMPKGWYELSYLSQQDRIEFTRDFWLLQLPLSGSRIEKNERRLEEFFENVESIEIYASQIKPSFPYETYMLYTMKNESGFFQGNPPAKASILETVQRQFSQFPLPEDYLAFQKIHDGFSKYTDTGLILLKEMARTYRKLQELLIEQELLRPDGEVLNPKMLIPFYESYGLHSYQCFYADWYPENEMGNLFFSAFDYSVSNFIVEEPSEKNLAFTSFAEWLAFYLEDLFS
jgi:hypothetical protein